MSKNKFLRLVVDTNLWISFLISNRLRKLDSLLLLEKLHFVFSKELLDEINSTITKPRLQKYFSASTFDEMLLTLEPYIEIVNVKSKIKLCRDPKDNFLLALSKMAKQIICSPAIKTCSIYESSVKQQSQRLHVFLKKQNTIANSLQLQAYE